jgi:hypothetical protein
MTTTTIPSGHPDYFGLVDDVTSTVTATVPPTKTVLMVSKGDEELLRLGSRSGWHFPRLNDGRYAGYYPADGADAIEQLEQQRERGADYIVFPATSMWWLDHYPELAEHLADSYETVLSDGTCTIYDLSGNHVRDGADANARPAAPETRGDEEEEQDPRDPPVADPAQLAAFLDVILPDEAIVGIVSAGDERLLALEGRELWHFPRDAAGAYADQGPADIGAALDQLEGLRAQGMTFLVVPRETPWLDHYPGFTEQVGQRHRCVARRRYLCSVYDLTGSRQVHADPPRHKHWRPWHRLRARAGGGG